MEPAFVLRAPDPSPADPPDEGPELYGATPYGPVIPDGYVKIGPPRLSYRVWLHGAIGAVHDARGVTQRENCLEMLAILGTKCGVEFVESRTPGNTTWRFWWEPPYATPPAPSIWLRSRQMNYFGDGGREGSVYVAAMPGHGDVHVACYDKRFVPGELRPLGRDGSIRCYARGWFHSNGWPNSPANRGINDQNLSGPVAFSAEEERALLGWAGPAWLRRAN